MEADNVTDIDKFACHQALMLTKLNFNLFSIEATIRNINF